jgi:hypothetical protein
MALQTHTRERDVFEHGTFVLFKRMQQQNIVLMQRNAVLMQENAAQLKFINDLQTTSHLQQEQIAKIQENEAFMERMQLAFTEQQLAFTEHRKKQKGSAGNM